MGSVGFEKSVYVFVRIREISGMAPDAKRSYGDLICG
jgi:hypothetical protein